MPDDELVGRRQRELGPALTARKKRLRPDFELQQVVRVNVPVGDVVDPNLTGDRLLSAKLSRNGQTAD